MSKGIKEIPRPPRVVIEPVLNPPNIFKVTLESGDGRKLFQREFPNRVMAGEVAREIIDVQLVRWLEENGDKL